MLITMCSVITGLLWFTVAAVIGSCFLWFSKKGMPKITLFIFALAILRVLFPVRFLRSYTVESGKWYAPVQALWQTELFAEVTVLHALTLVWEIGALISLLIIGYKLFRLYRIRKRAIPAAQKSREAILLRRAAEHMGYKGACQIAVSTAFSTPVLAGYFRLHILLPERASDLSDAELQYVLYHEIAHFQRRDLWLKLGLLILRSLLWWNPAVYLLARNAEQALELQCDKTVCRHFFESEKLTYLEAIVRLLQNNPVRQAKVPLGYVGVISKRYIKQRFQTVLSPAPVPKLYRKELAVLLCLIVFFVSYSVILQPACGDWGIIVLKGLL